MGATQSNHQAETAPVQDGENCFIANVSFDPGSYKFGLILNYNLPDDVDKLIQVLREESDGKKKSIHIMYGVKDSETNIFKESVHPNFYTTGIRLYNWGKHCQQPITDQLFFSQFMIIKYGIGRVKEFDNFATIKFDNKFYISTEAIENGLEDNINLIWAVGFLNEAFGLYTSLIKSAAKI